MNELSVVVEHLCKKYQDVTALEDLSLKIRKGELFGLLGPNGAGKTTTINILCGLVKSSSGTATICGFDSFHESSRVKDLIGVCTQETAIYPYLTGAENVEFFGNLHTMDKAALKTRSRMLLAKMGLTEDSKRRSGKYSGGMKRRLNLILALISNPQIVFLDEPTVTMDPQSRHAVWDFLKELKKDDKTIILTTHYMEEAEELCDRIGIIDHGKLIALGAPKELIVENQVKDLEELFLKLTGRNIRGES